MHTVFHSPWALVESRLLSPFVYTSCSLVFLSTYWHTAFSGRMLGKGSVPAPMSAHSVGARPHLHVHIHISVHFRGCTLFELPTHLAVCASLLLSTLACLLAALQIHSAAPLSFILVSEHRFASGVSVPCRV